MIPSWREAASQEAQDDLDGLVNATLPFAQQMLEGHGEFFPFAAAVTSDGTIELVGTDPGADDRPASTEVLNQLVGGLRDRVGNLRAAALVADPTIIAAAVASRRGPPCSVRSPCWPATGCATAGCPVRPPHPVTVARISDCPRAGQLRAQTGSLAWPWDTPGNAQQYGPWALAAYQAVQTVVPSLLALLDDDVRLRRAVAHLVAWFPRWASRSLPRLRARLVVEPDPDTKATMLVALGLLASAHAQTDDAPRLTRLLGDAEVVVRLFPQAPPEPAVRQLLGWLTGEASAGRHPEILFCHPQEYALLVVRSVPALRERAAEAILVRLPALSGQTGHSLVWHLIKLAFEEDRPQREVAFADLQPLQQLMSPALDDRSSKSLPSSTGWSAQAGSGMSPRPRSGAPPEGSGDAEGVPGRSGRVRGPGPAPAHRPCPRSRLVTFRDRSGQQPQPGRDLRNARSCMANTRAAALHGP